ncbi:TOBE domain-containing protein [Isoptericola sp. b441]|uniref:TOBE domain-containing protein n=2 Tax=Actinotalea lenta TaxID=3064654 RepID=A0ABT9DAW3_9CELL|nr:TOBE domain-containing protein [Isoptericola sp. b441]MDO8108030.1 TOBE domain-containing protein [Isoptericola sp. b441]
MVQLRMSQVADVLGVSADTVRRLVDSGRLPSSRDGGRPRLVDGADLAAYLRAGRDGPAPAGTSARNRFRGLVTDVRTDTVMAQVELQAGPHRVVSLMSREAVEELGLEPGVLATAVVKATMVVVERDREHE